MRRSIRPAIGRVTATLYDVFRCAASKLTDDIVLIKTVLIYVQYVRTTSWAVWLHLNWEASWSDKRWIHSCIVGYEDILKLLIRVHYGKESVFNRTKWKKYSYFSRFRYSFNQFLWCYAPSHMLHLRPVLVKRDPNKLLIERWRKLILQISRERNRDI